MGGESIFIEFVLARYYYCFSGKLLICRVVKQDFIGKETGIVLSECRYSTVRVPSSLVCHGRGKKKKKEGREDNKTKGDLIKNRSRGNN